MTCKVNFTYESGGLFVKVVNRVKELRQKKKLTQVQMAKDLQITRQTIHAIERNKYNPSLALALRMVQYFAVPIEEIFYLKEEDSHDE